MKAAKTQDDRNMNFDGMESIAPKHSSKLHTNHWSGHANDGREVNFGRGPTVAGRTGHKTPGSTGSVPQLPAQGSVRDNINRGSQYRGEGGVMAKSPANPDKIRVGQTGGPSYGALTKGTKPTTAAGQNDFNYGPKKQY